MDLFEKGADAGQSKTREAAALYERYERLAAAITNGIEKKYGDKFRGDGFEFRSGQTSIYIKGWTEYGQEVELRIFGHPDRDGNPLFGDRSLSHYSSVKNTNNMTEVELIEALGEVYGRLLSGTRANRDRLQAHRNREEKHRIEQYKKAQVAEAAAINARITKWFGIAVVAAVALVVLYA